MILHVMDEIHNGDDVTKSHQRGYVFSLGSRQD